MLTFLSSQYFFPLSDSRSFLLFLVTITLLPPLSLSLSLSLSLHIYIYIYIYIFFPLLSLSLFHTSLSLPLHLPPSISLSLSLSLSSTTSLCLSRTLFSPYPAANETVDIKVRSISVSVEAQRADQKRATELLVEDAMLVRTVSELLATENVLREQACQAQILWAEARRQTQPPPYWRMQKLVSRASQVIDITAEFKDKFHYFLNSISRYSPHLREHLYIHDVRLIKILRWLSDFF